MITENTYENLCRLLGAWVNGGAPALDAPDFDALFQAADRHLLSAAACAALEQTGLMDACPPETARRFRDAGALAVRRTILMDAEREAILDFLEKSGIWYMPLKGVVLNGLYPRYGTRQFSDNDILFDPARWREVRDFMKGRGYKPHGVGEGTNDAYYKLPIYNFELHRRLFAGGGVAGRVSGFLTAAGAYYADVKDRLVKDEENRFGYHFRDEDFYVYDLAHSYRHWSGEGAGLRTVLDIYLYRRAKVDMDEAYIEGELEKLGLTEFESLFRALGEKLFGPAPAPALTGQERKALELAERSGVYGTLEHGVQSDLRQMQGGEGPIDGRTKAKYLLGQLFPDREWYRVNVPFAYQHGWIMPLYWVYRLGRAVFVNGGRTFKILREIYLSSGSDNGTAGQEEDLECSKRSLP